MGSRGPLVHWDLWERLWCSWQLFGDSVSVQWVPSHVRVRGNEQADRCAQQGATAPLPSVREARTTREAWQELGLEEMSECDEEPMSVWDVDSGGSDSHSTGTETDEKVMSGDSDSDSDCAMLEFYLRRGSVLIGIRGGGGGAGGRADPNRPTKHSIAMWANSRQHSTLVWTR